MIRWLLKGIWRDKTRSLFPFLVITVGVTLLIYLLGFMEGVFAGMIDISAHLDTGHLRFVNKPRVRQSPALVPALIPILVS